MDHPILTRQLQPLPEDEPVRDRALDGLRGICALIVLYTHLVLGGAPDSGISWGAAFMRLNAGFAAVLMFFVISGYAIGLSTRAPATGAEMRIYLRRRFWRLVPVNTVAVLLSWLVLPVLTWDAVAGNLLFLQNREVSYFGWAVPLLPSNTNLWTLNFEVVYYLGFILLWRGAWRVGPVLAVVAAVVLAGALWTGFPTALSRYACGALYWIAGLWAAWQTPAAAGAVRTRWPSAIFAAVALWSLSGLRGVFYLLGWDSWIWATPVSPHRLDFLPGCLWVLLAVTGRGPRLQRPLAMFCLGWPAVNLAWRLATTPVTELEIYAAVALALAGLLWWWPSVPTLLRRLAPIGAISYGIYALGSPLQFGLRQYFPAVRGSAAGFVVRLLLLTTLACGLAWLVERQVQPWLKRRFMPPGRGA